MGKKDISIRVEDMKKEYISLFEQGLSIEEIAKRFHICDSTVYKSLAEIALANNILDRAQLLPHPQKSHNIPRSSGSSEAIIVNIEEIKSMFSNITDSYNALISKIDQTLELDEKGE